MKAPSTMPEETQSISPPRSIGSRRRKTRIGLALVVLACVAIALIFKVGFKAGLIRYSIAEIVLTNEVDDQGYPVGNKRTFSPSETIICSVLTEGTEATIGMRWYHENELIFEHFGRTENNHIITYIQSDKSVILQEGNYHVDIYTFPSEPFETIHFRIEKYQLEVIPPLPTPTGHRDLEGSPYTEVPFAFDEVWEIEGKKWQINEVKIILLEPGDQFVVVVALTDLDNFSDLTEEAAKEIAKPVALYAIEQGYLARASEFMIDGQYYDLGAGLFVNLLNASAQRVYRVMFEMEELTD